MPNAFPPIEPVRVRGAGARHGARGAGEDAFAVVETPGSALAVVAEGMSATRSAREAADLTVETCTRIFRGRALSVLDELAETWWLGEHGEETASGLRARRPYASLPIADRVGLRERVSRLLEERVPDSLGDIAVLEAETASFLDLSARGLRRASADIYRRAEADPRWRGHGAAAACIVFAAGQAGIAHAGDCRVARIHDGSIEVVTREHTLRNATERAQPELTAEELEKVPDDVVVNALGMTDAVAVDTHVVPALSGDVFLLMTDGAWKTFSSMELLTTVRGRGLDAATYLIERGRRRETYLALVVLQVL